MNSISERRVCIIGAGPYGLAIAAHLRHVGVEFRIFGSVMRRWLSQMPKAMLLKSEGCATGLPDPEGRLGFAQFCRQQGLPYAEYAAPVARDNFVRYALSFQQKMVPEVEDCLVTSVRKTAEEFEVQLGNGETFRSAQVIVATGLDQMEYLPEQLAGLPSELAAHSATHYDLSKFKGKEVVVIGGGQSGLETAALLREEGASPTLVVRASTIAWNRYPSMERRPLYKRIRRPRTRLGEGLQLWVYEHVPHLFHCLPRQVRLSRVRASLGPAGAWWLKKRVVNQMPILLGHQLRAVEIRNGRVALQLTDLSGQPTMLVADHVIAATGYRYNFRKLPFLDHNLMLRIRHEEQMPQLSSNFESSVRGLYFTGLSSANAFGPAMRFLVGTSFTARRISAHIAGHMPSPASSFAPPQKCIEN